MPWLVYILRCRDGSLYTGITNDLPKRLKAHAATYRIDSGCDEGACRQLVKGRIESNGMRSTMPRAQAVLHRRSISRNGRRDEFIEHRVETEHTRRYGNSAA